MMCHSVARTTLGGFGPTPARLKYGPQVTTERRISPSSKVRPSPSTSARIASRARTRWAMPREQVSFECAEESRHHVEQERPLLAAVGEPDAPVPERPGQLHRALTELGGLVAAQISEEPRTRAGAGGALNISFHAADESSLNTNPHSATPAIAHCLKVSSACVIGHDGCGPQGDGRSRHVGRAPRATGSSGPLDVISQSIARAPSDAVTSPYVASVRN
jgi:hypothetical protein